MSKGKVNEKKVRGRSWNWNQKEGSDFMRETMKWVHHLKMERNLHTHSNEFGCGFQIGTHKMNDAIILNPSIQASRGRIHKNALKRGSDLIFEQG